MKSLVLLFLAALWFVPASQSFADSPTTQSSSANTVDPTTMPSPRDPPTTRIGLAVLQHLQKTLSGVTTVEADFIQEKKLKILDRPLIIKGHFALQKPDRLIWIVREPVRYAVRIQGDEVRQWDEDTNRVDVMHLAGDPTFRAVSDQIEAWFLGDYDALANSYDVDVLSQNPLTLNFAPKSDSMVAKFLMRVKVHFSDDERTISEMDIDEAAGDSTTLHFINSQVNQPIGDDVWRIPPSGN